MVDLIDNVVDILVQYYRTKKPSKELLVLVFEHLEPFCQSGNLLKHQMNLVAFFTKNQRKQMNKVLCQALNFYLCNDPLPSIDYQITNTQFMNYDKKNAQSFSIVQKHCKLFIYFAGLI